MVNASVLLATCSPLINLLDRVGGVVAEKNFKFFIQFNTYTCLYTLFILITMAYFVHDRSANVRICTALPPAFIY